MEDDISTKVLKSAEAVSSDSLAEQEAPVITPETPVLFVVDDLPSTASHSTVTDLSNSACGLNSSFLSTLSTTDDYNIHDLLSQNILGRAILQKATDGVHLNNRDRSNICDIIISHFLNKESVKLDNQCLSKIADDIVKSIPLEKTSTYYVAPVSKRNSGSNRPQVARGKLVDKHRNKLTALRRTLQYRNLHPPEAASTVTSGKIVSI